MIMDKPQKHQPNEDDPLETAQGEEQKRHTPDEKLATFISCDRVEEGDVLDLERDVLYLNALNELRSIKDKLSLSAQEREGCLRSFLARAYALSMEGKRNPARQAELRLKSGIKFRSDTPHHKQTIRALQRKLGEPLPKGSEHEWAQVLWGLEEAGVGESEDAVVAFLTEPDDIDGKRVCGFARAHAALRASKHIKDERTNRLNKLKAERETTFYNVLASARDQPVGSITISEDVDLDEGPWISINEGGEALLKLKITVENMQSLVLRYA